jgi:hypothetical protein
MKGMVLKSVLLIMLIVGVSACAKAQSGTSVQSQLIGRWVPIEGEFMNSWRYEFTTNSLSINGGNAQNVEYKIEDGVIKTTWLGTVFVIADSFEFIDDDTLRFVGGNEPGVYKRVK